MKPIIDKTLQRWTSRKLFVWACATGLLLGKFLTGDEWVAIALVYLGSQGLADIASKWKGA